MPVRSISSPTLWHRADKMHLFTILKKAIYCNKLFEEECLVCKKVCLILGDKTWWADDTFHWNKCNFCHVWNWVTQAVGWVKTKFCHSHHVKKQMDIFIRFQTQILHIPGLHDRIWDFMWNLGKYQGIFRNIRIEIARKIY